MRIKVPLFGTPSKYAMLDREATNGAQFGVNLLDPSGSLVKWPIAVASTGSDSIGTTDDLEEGQFNLWFTPRRAQDAVGGILDDTATVEFAYTGGESIAATLKDLADSGTGTSLVKITRDGKGRISGTSDATTTDLTEGSNLYFTNARSDARITLQKGMALGLAPLGGDGKINVSFLPAAVLGQVSYQGTWDASAGTPPTATPEKGWYYIVTVAGSTDLDGITDWDVGDWAIYNGATWDKIDNTDAVVTVNGHTGAVTLTASDVGAATSAQGALADSAVQPGDLGTAAALNVPASGDAGPTEVVLGNDSRLGGGGGSGDVVGPASSVDGDLAVFDGITGKLIKSGGALNKAAVGLGNADNTSDVNKPVSTAQQTAMDALSFKNRLINGDFAINQRAFVGGALAAGVYGFDRWKAGAGGCNVSLSGGVLTHTSGALIQVMEAPGLASTTVTVSVEDPSGSISVDVDGVTGTITAGAGRRGVSIAVPSGSTGNVTLKLTATGVTYKRVQVELESTATAFEVRPIGVETLLCQRYCFSISTASGNAFVGAAGYGSTSAIGFLYLPVQMRVVPAGTAAGLLHMTPGTGSGAANLVSVSAQIIAILLTQTTVAVGGAGYFSATGGAQKITLDAEL